MEPSSRAGERTEMPLTAFSTEPTHAAVRQLYRGINRLEHELDEITYTRARTFGVARSFAVLFILIANMCES